MAERQTYNRMVVMATKLTVNFVSYMVHPTTFESTGRKKGNKQSNKHKIWWAIVIVIVTSILVVVMGNKL